MEGTKKCTDQQHHNLGSKFPADVVPIEFFRKDPDDVDSEIFNTCVDCRAYKRKLRIKAVAKLKAAAKASWDADGDFLFCTVNIHNSNSKYPRDKVPRELFRKVPTDPKSSLIKTCRDCAEARAKYKVVNNTAKLEKVKKMPDNFICSTCHQIKHIDTRSINPDGTLAASCITCKELKIANRIKKTIAMKEVLMKRIKEQSSSCLSCCNIYLLDPKDDNHILTFETVEIDGVRMVYIDGCYIRANYFIEATKENHCFEVLVFDHLTEDEQRERGLLAFDEPYIPKVRGVAHMTSKVAKEREALKCQLLCVMCHMIETISRERRDANFNGLMGFKKKYVHNLKALGCAICGYINLEIPRLFEMDHLNPSTKTTEVSVMVVESKYTMEMLQAECAKCQVLCLHCHKLVTRNQRRAGII